jgi:hypothetical protein
LRLVLLFLLTTACARGPSERAEAPTLDVEACRQCHASVVDSYVQTAHFATSSVASRGSIKGHFEPPANVMRTRSPTVAFRLEQRADGFYQTALDTRTLSAHSERFDLAVGSGRRGQTYLYWKNGILFQLPVSYLAATDGWINSPGYPDGQIDFGRVIQPRCLECHSTWFAIELDSATHQSPYAQGYRLGLTCEKCHGDARRHVEDRTSRSRQSPGNDIYSPARQPRDERVEACGLCHSGVLQPRRPAFTYRPGEPLDTYFAPDSSLQTTAPDVHGNQVRLLSQSACYRQTPEMSCSTCHDVHRPERDPQSFTGKCLGCHQVEKHPGSRPRAELTARCIQCHMPTSPSRGLQINTPAGRIAIQFRTHRIAVYRPTENDTT